MSKSDETKAISIDVVGKWVNLSALIDNCYVPGLNFFVLFAFFCCSVLSSLWFFFFQTDAFPVSFHIMACAWVCSVSDFAPSEKRSSYLHFISLPLQYYTEIYLHLTVHRAVRLLTPRPWLHPSVTPVKVRRQETEDNAPSIHQSTYTVGIVI